MQIHSIYVDHVTFMVEAEDEQAALSEVEGILWDNAHDWGQLEVS